MGDVKALVIPADDTGCGRFRLKWPAEAVRSSGGNLAINRWHEPDEMKFSVIRDFEQAPDIIGRKRSYPVVGVKDFDADVLVLQRPASRNLLRTIQLVQKQLGKAVVVDVDDALWAIHPKNVSYPIWQDNRKASNWRWLLKCCRAADLVTVTTKALRDKLGGVVLQNCVPDSYLKVGAKREAPVTVGWGGTITTHPDDLQVTRKIIPVAVRDAGAEFVAMGGGLGELDVLGFEEGDSASHTGPIQIDQWPKMFAGLDVSLVPLADTPFNRAKSWLKGLEASALGSVPIMSPTPDNMLLHQRGIGLIARRPRNWRSHILELALNDTFRQEMSERGRAIASELTFSKNAWLWEQAWDLAYRIRKGTAKKPQP